MASRSHHPIRANSCSFFDLPAEIRLAIYKYAFNAGERPFCKLRLHCSIPLTSGEEDINGARRWSGIRTYPYPTDDVRLTEFLFSCRQIYEEACTIAWQGTDVDLLDQSSMVQRPLIFFRDIRLDYMKRLRRLTFAWETIRDILDDKSEKAYASIFTSSSQLRLKVLHLRVNNPYDAFMGVYQSFIHRWYSMPHVETLAAEWTIKCRSQVDFEYYTSHMKTNLHPHHRLTVQYDPTDYNYEFPTLIVSSSRDSELDDRLPDRYPYVDRIGDNSDVE